MTENKPYIEAMRDLRRGSRTSPHEDSRTQRARTRQDSDRRAIQEYR